MGKRLIVLLCAVTMIMAACKKDSDSIEKLSASINGKNWVASLRPTTLAGEVFVITGTSLTGEMLIITIIGKTPGTYEFNLNDQKCNVVYKKSGLSTSPTDIYTSISGRVELKKVDLTNKKITGTFEFNCAGLNLLNPILIKNGSFNDLGYLETPIENQ